MLARIGHSMLLVPPMISFYLRCHFLRIRERTILVFQDIYSPLYLLHHLLSIQSATLYCLLKDQGDSNRLIGRMDQASELYFGTLLSDRLR